MNIHPTNIINMPVSDHEEESQDSQCNSNHDEETTGTLISELDSEDSNMENSNDEHDHTKKSMSHTSI